MLSCTVCGTALESCEGACPTCRQFTAPALTCTPQQFLYLISLAGGKFAMGIPDAFAGLDAAGVATACAQARGQLRQAGLLFTDGVSSLPGVFEPVLTWLKIISAPEQVFLVQSSGKALDLHRYVYRKERQWVVLDHADDHLSVRALDHMGTVWDDLDTRWALADRKKCPGEPFTLSEPVFVSTRKAMEKNDLQAAWALLKGAGLVDLSAKALMLTLGSAERYGTVIRLDWDGQDWKSAGTGILAGECGLWAISIEDRGDTPWFTFTPADRQVVRELVERLAPAPRVEA